MARDMIDPHTSTASFCQQASNSGYLVVDKASGLAGRTFTKKLASSFTDITEFVGSIVAKKDELACDELLDLKNAYKKVCKSKIRWYHKILALVVPSYKNLIVSSQELEAQLERLTLFAFISIAVNVHLQPYLTGQITEATQNKRRDPLIDALEPAMQSKFPQGGFKRNLIEKFAFEAYIKHAAEHFIKQLPALVPDAPEWEDPVREIMEAVKKAVAIDFTPAFLARHTVQKEMLDALWGAIQKKNTEGFS